MSERRMPTEFASAERASDSELVEQARVVQCEPLIQQLFDALNTIVLILNENRQIVFANRMLLDSTEVPELKAVLGRRPGELLDCMHAGKTPGGCGTSRNCRECGAVQAILSSQKDNERDVRVCRILRDGTGEALNMRVCAFPFSVHGESYTVFSIEDISDSERRKSLERIFFHDLMNTAIGVRGLGELLRIAGPDEMSDFTERIYVSADSLVSEIESQRELLAIENKELEVKHVRLEASRILKDVDAVYRTHEVARDRILDVKMPASEIFVNSDKALLERVVGNMTKNALEASHAGDQVTVSCCVDGSSARFDVHNPGYIPSHVQLQIFQRSFSTKGSGRGLGTYSMKLISERYLAGHVEFVSEPDNGTTFSALIPLSEDRASVADHQPLPDKLALKVLIADDNLVNAKVIERQLEKVGCEVAVVHTGRAAVGAVQMRSYDVVLMDIEMPELDGLEATREIVASQAPKERPFIIGLTAHRLKEDVERCLDAGMNDYLPKPVEREDLFNKLAALT